MMIKFPVPLEALAVIKQDLESVGCTVTLESCGRRGHVTCPAGVVQFFHEAGALTIHILQDKGHFPKAMLVGGFRQLVEEAVERLPKECLA